MTTNNNNNNTTNRKVVKHDNGYKEVDLGFRKVRAAALEAAKVHLRSDRIHCPALDASRTEGAYGCKALPSTDKAGLDRWSDGLGLPRGAVATIAYGSGAWYKVPLEAIRGEFDENQVNTGLIKSLKHDVHTGILSQGAFDQEAFNRFVWAVHPQLKGTTIDNNFLHSDGANDLFISSDKMHEIMEHNREQSTSLLKGLGVGLSKFEMEKLLLKKLGQAINLKETESQDENADAISLRDLHDLYKYGVFPAMQEDQLLEAGLIKDDSVAMSGSTSC